MITDIERPLTGLRARLLLAATVVAVWPGPSRAEADGGLQVVASIKPVHSLVAAVMAGVGEPHLLMPGASSPHTFSLTPSDAGSLADADLVFLIGEAMETTLADAVEALVRKERAFTLSEADGLLLLPIRTGGAFDDHSEAHRGDDGAGDHGHDDHGHDDHGHDDHGHAEDHARAAADRGPPDPHLWLDPANAAAMARTISAVLSEADPLHADAYGANAEALVRRLEELTTELDRVVAPVRGQSFVTFHDAYHYFENRFGLTAAGSIVVSPERAPGIRRIRQLREKVRDLSVGCVLSEPQFDQRLVGVIVEDADVRTGVVDPLGFGVEDGPELYFTVLRNMAEVFRACLLPASSGGGT